MSFTAAMPPYNATDPTASFLNASCFDFLLIELVPLAYRVTNELELPRDSSSPASPPPGDTTSPGGARRLNEEDEREAAAYRLDMLGYRVGQGIVERLVPSASASPFLQQSGSPSRSLRWSSLSLRVHIPRVQRVQHRVRGSYGIPKC